MQATDLVWGSPFPANPSRKEGVINGVSGSGKNGFNTESLFSSFSLDAKLIIAEMSSLSGAVAAAVEDVSKKLSRDLCCRFLEGWFSFELENKRYIFAVHFIGCLWENLCVFF